MSRCIKGETIVCHQQAGHSGLHDVFTDNPDWQAIADGLAEALRAYSHIHAADDGPLCAFLDRRCTEARPALSAYEKAKEKK